MSTKHGSSTRQRPQKYKNRTAFKNDLHDKTPQQKLINSIHVCEVCDRCKSVIEWKIKYKKYKPLTQPKTCIKCQRRNIKKAYHVLCRDCAVQNRVCAKCLKSGEEVRIEPPQPTEEEQLKLKVEMEKLIKSLPERKRRSFLRYMKKGKRKNESIPTEVDDSNVEKSDKDDSLNLENKIERVPHSRDDLLKKIEELKVADGDDDDDLDDDESDDDDSDFEVSDDLLE